MWARGFSTVKPGGALISADLSTGPAANLREQNLIGIWERMMRFTGVASEQVAMMCETLERDVAVAPAAEVAAIIAEAGFAPPALFYQSLLIHAWTTQRPA